MLKCLGTFAPLQLCSSGRGRSRGRSSGSCSSSSRVIAVAGWLEGDGCRLRRGFAGVEMGVRAGGRIGGLADWDGGREGDRLGCRRADDVQTCRVQTRRRAAVQQSGRRVAQRGSPSWRAAGEDGCTQAGVQPLRRWCCCWWTGGRGPYDAISGRCRRAGSSWRATTGHDSACIPSSPWTLVGRRRRRRRRLRGRAA